MNHVQYSGKVQDKTASYSVFGPVQEDAIRAGQMEGNIIDENFDAGCAAAATTYVGWNVTEVTSGQLDPSGEAGGGLILKGDTADGDGIQMDKAEFVKVATGKKFAMEAIVKMNSISLPEFAVGLGTTDADYAGSLPNDLIAFVMVSGSANINAQVSKNGTGAAVDTGVDFVAATYVNLGFRYENDEVKFYVDGVLKTTTTTNIPDDETLAPFIAVQASSSGDVTATVARIKVVSEL